MRHSVTAPLNQVGRFGCSFATGCDISERMSLLHTRADRSEFGSTRPTRALQFSYSFRRHHDDLGGKPPGAVTCAFLKATNAALVPRRQE